MSLTVKPKALVDALAAVKPAVGSRSANGALKGVRITAGENLGELVTTDLSVAARRLLPCTTEGKLNALVSHEDLAKAVGRFAKRDSVTLKPSEEGLAVTDGQRTIELRELKREDWPKLDFGAGKPWFDAPGAELAALIARAERFASKDETRPVLTGLMLEPATSTLVVTDSYRLGIFNLPVSECHADDVAANVPAAHLKIAVKTIKASSAVALRRESGFVHIRTADCDWRIRTIEGQFPNWKQLWPEFAEPGYAEVEVKLPVSELLEACDTAKAFAKGNAPLRLNVNGGVKIHGTTPGVCSFSEELAGATIAVNSQEEFEIGMNPDYLHDIAKIASNGSLTVRMATPLRPVAWLDGEDRYLLMPIRLTA